MALRLLELFIPQPAQDRVRPLLDDQQICDCQGFWVQLISDQIARVTVLISTENTEGLIDSLNNRKPLRVSRQELYTDIIALALASGGAGALSFTTGLSTTLVGVMVAVALLPPLVTAGTLFGAGHAQPALGAALLFLTNLICVNLAGVTTFLAQGIRPTTWWEADKAKHSVRTAITLWLVLLSGLAGLIVLARVR